MFYLTPLENEFKISMTIKENERYSFMQDDALKDVNSLFLTAKKFENDYSVQFSVKNADECELIKRFIQKLITIRK